MFVYVGPLSKSGSKDIHYPPSGVLYFYEEKVEIKTIDKTYDVIIEKKTKKVI